MSDSKRAHSMRALLRSAVSGAGALILLVLISVSTLAAVGYGHERRVHRVPAVSLTIPTDSAAIARGRHLATAVASCTSCHALDLGGKAFLDAGALGVFAAPNLTRGPGGLPADYTVDDWVRAIRFGVRSNGTSLLAMPSDAFAHLSDEDLGALIAYLETLPSVDRQLPRPRVGMVGRILVATGQRPLLVAERTPRPEHVAAVRPHGEEYGRYLVSVAGCAGCHGSGLVGGRVAWPPGTPPTPDLTSAGPMAAWSRADFVRAMRTGWRPDGSVVDELRRCRYAGLTDAELRAIFTYLRALPAGTSGDVD